MQTAEGGVDLNDRQALRIAFQVRSMSRKAARVWFWNGPPGRTDAEKWGFLLHTILRKNLSLYRSPILYVRILGPKSGVKKKWTRKEF